MGLGWSIFVVRPLRQVARAITEEVVGVFTDDEDTRRWVGTAVAVGTGLFVNKLAFDAVGAKETLASELFSHADALADGADAADAAGFVTAAESLTPGALVPDAGPAHQWVDAITRACGHHSIPVFTQENVRNAFCHIQSVCQGDEFISYDPAFLQDQAARFGPEAGVGILAHEVGHAHCGVLTPGMADWSDERRADFFAGQTLAKFNLNPQPFLDSLKHLGADDRHAYGALRVQDVINGYYSAGGQLPTAA